ncbi:Hypothetical protein NCS54_00437100 [Fusarium falciforme]|uniref:Hypothetical protein n=1 Tax=Fusarium falciforme TaxID=195108 RepID=UPI002301B0F8|nr:Hypothetical protein NCS54_00437100 [Fusarium falciforme]WAO87076.1 Hypothetical protein NCS54_00437100 [Fusarium falciforme]
MKTNKNQIFRIEDASRQPTGLYDRVTWTLVDQPNNEPSRAFLQYWRLLGEVRLDGLQEPVMKAERDTIWLGFRHEDVWTEDASPHLAEMAFEPLDMAPMDVLEMPLRELLDWWFSCYQYYLISGDQTSPRPVSTSPRDWAYH